MDKAELEKLYIKKKLSASKIANRYGMATSSIMYWLKKYNIPRRTSTEGLKLAMNVVDNNCKCLTCGKEFHLKPTETEKARGKYCSLVCYRRARSKKLKINNKHKFTTEKTKGNKNFKFVDGKHKLRNKYKSTKDNARRRNLYFDISLNQFEALISRPCVYCGEPSTGLDRIDNNKGYVLSNVVPACSWCNWMKKDKNVFDFYHKITKIFHKIEGGDALCVDVL